MRWVPLLVGFATPVLGLDGTQWERSANSESHVLSAYVAFHQPQLEAAAALLDEISNPQSTRFGEHLNALEVASRSTPIPLKSDAVLTQRQQRMFSPAQDALERTLDWLETAGVHRASSRVHLSSSILKFSATQTQLRKLLEADVHVLKHRDTGEERLQETEFLPPRHLADDIEFITVKSNVLSRLQARQQPRVNTNEPPYKTPVQPDLTNCSLSWTPACIRELYGIPIGTKAAPNNALGIFGYGDFYNQSDLNNFWIQYAQFIPQGTKPKVHFINGAQSYKEEIDGEEKLDLQMSYPIAYPQKVEIFQSPYSDLDGIANDFLDAVDASYCTYDGGDDPQSDPTYPAFMGFPGPPMCGTYNITNVLSISFAKDESGLSRHYVQRQCHEWMKLGLQGITVLVAAGDRGVSGNFGCSINKHNSSLSAFNPLFPGTCPYVTTVGATQVNFTEKTYQEVAVYDKKHNYWSGGGFSNFMLRPKWQERAVKQYLATHDPKYPAGTYNASGRGFPDVAMLGANVTISDGLEIVVSGGTSAATPLFAGLISRINDERILAGKKSIGFLNQILYQHPEVMNDIVDGSNPGCDTPGFQTATGWDPVSGLGAPSFPRLRELLVGLS